MPTCFIIAYYVQNTNKKPIIWKFAAFFFSTVLMLFLSILFLSILSLEFQNNMRAFLIKKLAIKESSAYHQPAGNQPGNSNFIYILGGSQNSLRLKYRKAASLVQRGVSERIFVLHSPGITEFARDLGRNLTNDEWTLRQLTRLGVEEERIEFISLQENFFGTLTEAKTLRSISMERGIDTLVLVCSTYHSKRVRVTFSGLLEGSGVEFEIQTVDERIGLGGLLIECAKLFLYENILIPFERWSQEDVLKTNPILPLNNSSMKI